MSSITLAFDVYGTLIDIHGVDLKLHELIGSRAKDFSRAWREKQLEYSFRRGLMQEYENFAVCTKQALDYTCSQYNVDLTQADKQGLLELYRTLPIHKDVKQSLKCLIEAKFNLYAFSNGSAKTVDALLTSAGIREYFIDIVSVDEIKSFKPNPKVYEYFLKTSDTSASNAWLISSNPFDVIGAISIGMRAAWVQRSKEAIFDPWEIEPTLTVESLTDLRDKINLCCI
jgi:2-haloacid dehalogenase